MDKQKLLSWAKLFVGWPLSIISLIFLGKLIFDQSSHLNIDFSYLNFPVLLISIFLFFSYFLMRSFLWRTTLKMKGHSIPFLDNTYRFSLSEIKRYTPGNVWSFISRGSLFKEAGVDNKTIGIALVSDIHLVIIGCAIVALGALPFIFNSSSDLRGKLLSLIPISLILIAVYFVGTSLIYKKYRKNEKFASTLFLPGFSLREKLKLIGIATVTYAIFGIANYMAFVSLFNFDPKYALALPSFFTLSLLIGYLSFFTPTGLGVRELVVTLGLSQVMNASDAAAMSVFTRVVLIFSEVTFLAIVLSGRKSSSYWFKKIKLNWQEVVLLISTLIYGVYFTIASFMKYENYQTGKYDLGNMAQTIWNTIHGRFFLFTDPEGTREVSRLAYHADFILVLLSPFYALWQNPKVLLAIQTAVVSLGGTLVYLISEKVLKHRTISLILAICYFIYPAQNYANLFDFHAVTLATTFLLAAFYFILSKKWKTVLLFLALAGICKEEIWVITALFGIYIFVFEKKKLLGSAIAIISAFIFYILVWHLIPKNLGSQHFALSYYADYGDSPQKIIKNIFLHPVTTLGTILRPDRLDFLKQLFLPLGFLSLLAPLFLIFAAPDLVIDLLSSRQPLHQIYFHYAATMTPFIFIAAIYGIRTLHSRVPRFSYRNIGVALIFFSVVSAYFFGPLPLAKKANVSMFNSLPEKVVVDNYISTIPQGEKIAATNNLGAQLSHRRNIYVIPNGVDAADKALFLNIHYEGKYEEKALNKILTDPNYYLAYKSGRFYVFQKINLGKFN